MKEGIVMDKIYTKTGDKGTTSNLLGKTLSKADEDINLNGGVDEINSYVGYLRSKIRKAGYEEEDLKYIDGVMREIQYHLYLIGVEISTEFSEEHITGEEVKFLEDSIDKFTDSTEPMKSFIYYSGSETCTLAHVIRTTTRRIERDFVRTFHGRQYPVCYQYINRLSDFFFSLARYFNGLENIPDEPITIR